MTIDDFRTYVGVLNDRFSSHWKFMNEHHSAQWPLIMKRDEWVELLIQFIENDRRCEKSKE